MHKTHGKTAKEVKITTDEDEVNADQTIMYDLEWLTLLVHILEVLGSNLGQDTGYPE
jgi:hypothetical protein